MNITNNELKKMVDESGANELIYRAYAFENDENLSEIDYLIRETEWVLEDYTEDTGHCAYDEYMDAKYLLRKTKNGSCITYDIETFKPFYWCTEEAIRQAKALVQEVKDTRKLLKALRRYKEKKGE